MMRTIFEQDQRVPIRVWARAIDEETVRQLQRLARMPFVVDFVAAMADAHVSNGVAVGSVFATANEVVPRALGGDLGCGMSAHRIADDTPEPRVLAQIIRDLERAIPAGRDLHRGRGVDVPDALMDGALSTRALEHGRDALARKHLGTLGGGNHFVELDRDAEGALYLLVHSGSRGLGAAIFMHHTRIGDRPTADELVAHSLDSEAGRAYALDHAWALSFAAENRRALVRRAKETIAAHVAVLDDDDPIDIHHNFVREETWNGARRIVHRKGAVAIEKDARALVPGSMGTASYIVRGLGAEASLGSCSHGAGRVLTRKAARAEIDPRALAAQMKGIAFPERLLRDLVEEAPSAYRDIREVLDDQSDLVVREKRLTPVAVLKG